MSEDGMQGVEGEPGVGWETLLAGAGFQGARLFLTTNPGLESVVEAELVERLQADGIGEAQIYRKPFGFGGQVLVAGDEGREAFAEVALQMRSVHHVQVLLYGFELDEGEGLERIGRELAELDLAALEGAGRFRVTTKRSGEHDFTSIDVQRVAGEVLVQRYGCAVDLEHYDVNVRVDVLNRVCLVGLQLTERALSNRYRRRYKQRAALKAPVAYALLRWARLEAGARGALLDPFCGSGTILIEAAQLFPGLELCGCDIDQRAVEGTRENAEMEGLEERLQLRRADARELSQTFAAERFRAIVTNPPYGVKLGKHLNFARFYQRVLRECWTVLEQGGLLVIVVWKRTIFYRALIQSGLFKILEERVVETGELYPAVYVLEKIEAEAQSAIE